MIPPAHGNVAHWPVDRARTDASGGRPSVSPSASRRLSLRDRTCLAGAPISWGACEVPGWGPMPETEQVLAEMSAVGLIGTELGAPGFLPEDPAGIRTALARHRLQLAGAFLPLVLHRPSEQASALTQARAAAIRLAAASGPEATRRPTLVIALVEDLAWSTVQTPGDQEWGRIAANLLEIRGMAAEHGVPVVVHPHYGTLLETAEQIRRGLEAFVGIDWCLDTGHLAIAGYDPGEFARDFGDRVGHVHLKDVDAHLASRLLSGELSLLQASQLGLFRPLGDGDVDLAATLTHLDAHEYSGWLVLEQDTALTDREPSVGGTPLGDARRSIAFVHNVAHLKEEEVQ